MATSRARATIKYEKNHLKRIPLNVQKDYFDDVMLPAIDKSGLPVNTWIKLAIAEKLERDNK